MSPHRDCHLLAPIFLVEEQHVQDVLQGQAGVPPDVAIQHLLEVNNTATLLGDPAGDESCMLQVLQVMHYMGRLKELVCFTTRYCGK